MKYIILIFMEAFVFIPCAIFWIRTIDRHIRNNEMHKGMCDVTITRENWREEEGEDEKDGKKSADQHKHARGNIKNR